MAGEYATCKKQKERTKIGKAVSKAFREKYGKAPLTTRLATGHEANVNVYDEADWGWIKAHIVVLTFYFGGPVCACSKNGLRRPGKWSLNLSIKY